MLISEFLTAIADYLGAADLAPVPAAVGVAEPAAVGDLPSVVLSVEQADVRNAGVGTRNELVRKGALPVTIEVDLEDPHLPDDPTFTLVSADRLELVLHHGGLVRNDGTEGPLSAADIEVTVAGTGLDLAQPPPGANEFSAAPEVGRLTFGAPLPAAGVARAGYFVGQWERRRIRLSGLLRLDVCAASVADAVQLSDSTVDVVLQARRQVQGLLRVGEVSLGTVGPPEPDFANCRRRTARFRFEFELIEDRPDSSGGVIREVPVTAVMD